MKSKQLCGKEARRAESGPEDLHYQYIARCNSDDLRIYVHINELAGVRRDWLQAEKILLDEFKIHI
jgi:hypothetical protein